MNTTASGVFICGWLLLSLCGQRPPTAGRDTSKEKIPLAEEILFIENYIAFEKERLGDRCQITFNRQTGGDVNIEIAPFILFTFLENAFKHGTHFTRKSEIEIYLHAMPDRVIFKVANSIFRKAEHKSTNIGLVNTRRRLELLYPDCHTLDIMEDTCQFRIALQLFPVYEGTVKKSTV